MTEENKTASAWNFTPAPRSTFETVTRTLKDKTVEVTTVCDVYVIAALPSCDKVGKTRWLPQEERWEGMTRGQEPVAWQPWPEYPLEAIQ